MSSPRSRGSSARKRCLLEADGMPRAADEHDDPHRLGAARVGPAREARARGARRAPPVPDDHPRPARGAAELGRGRRDGPRLRAPRRARGAFRGDRAPAARRRGRPSGVRRPARSSSPTCRRSAAGAASPTGARLRSPSSSIVCDRLVVDSDGVARRAVRLRRARTPVLATAVSDIAWRRSLPWRAGSGRRDGRGSARSSG